jgi:hypothetical protein
MCLELGSVEVPVIFKVVAPAWSNLLSVQSESQDNVLTLLLVCLCMMETTLSVVSQCTSHRVQFSRTRSRHTAHAVVGLFECYVACSCETRRDLFNCSLYCCSLHQGPNHCLFLSFFNSCATGCRTTDRSRFLPHPSSGPCTHHHTTDHTSAGRCHFHSDPPAFPTRQQQQSCCGYQRCNLHTIVTLTLPAARCHP